MRGLCKKNIKKNKGKTFSLFRLWTPLVFALSVVLIPLAFSVEQNSAKTQTSSAKTQTTKDQVLSNTNKPPIVKAKPKSQKIRVQRVHTPKPVRKKTLTRKKPLARKKTLARKKQKIKVLPKPKTLSEQISIERGQPQLIDTFNSSLFKISDKKAKTSPLQWLYTPDIRKKRSKIKGSKKGAFEAWWKLNMEGFGLQDRTDYTTVIRARANAKILTQFTNRLFAQAEFELLTQVGSIQQIFQRPGETSGVSQREIFLLYKFSPWLTFQGGAINQRFLQSPLLLGDIPFPSLVENIDLYKDTQNTLSLSLQQAIPTTFSDKLSLYTPELDNFPLLFTGSVFWNYDPQSFYKLNIHATGFHYTRLPSDIAALSQFAGNTIVGQPPEFKHRYSGFYIGLEPSFQPVPNVAVHFKTHYVHNLQPMPEAKGHNKGLLMSLQVPWDITENIRITPIVEMFRIQPDASVGYYNSERYGHSDRDGIVGELILHLYDRNMEIGFRYLSSNPVTTDIQLKEGQTYYLLFLRTGYAKI